VAAPTLVKVLAAFLYLESLLRLEEAVACAVGLSDNSQDIMVNARLVFLALALALVPLLLGKRIARAERGPWLLTLVLTVVTLPFAFRAVVNGATVMLILHLVITVAVLALLLTPAVRRHCMKN
jgi:hypothetical protein